MNAVGASNKLRALLKLITGVPNAGDECFDLSAPVYDMLSKMRGSIVRAGLPEAISVPPGDYLAGQVFYDALPDDWKEVDDLDLAILSDGAVVRKDLWVRANPDHRMFLE